MRHDLVLTLVVACLTALAKCDKNPLKTTSSSPRHDEDHLQVESPICDNVVHTETVHVPAFTDQHHRLLQVHVRTNLQVRTASVTLCYLSAVLTCSVYLQHYLSVERGPPANVIS